MSHKVIQRLQDLDQQVSSYIELNMEKNEQTQNQSKANSNDILEALQKITFVNNYFSIYLTECNNYLKSLRPYQFDKERGIPQISSQIQQYGTLASQKYQCPYCDKKFSQGRQLGGHVSKVHPKGNIKKLKKYNSQYNLDSVTDEKSLRIKKSLPRLRQQSKSHSFHKQAKHESKNYKIYKSRLIRKQLSKSDE